MSKGPIRLVATPLLLAALAACSGAAKSVTSDATVTACTPGDGDRPSASGDIVNRSSKRSSFAVEVSFYDTSGNRVAEGADTVNGVEPGATGRWRAVATANAKGPINCKVKTVRRIRTPG